MDLKFKVKLSALSREHYTFSKLELAVTKNSYLSPYVNFNTIKIVVKKNKINNSKNNFGFTLTSETRNIFFLYLPSL